MTDVTQLPEPTSGAETDVTTRADSTPLKMKRPTEHRERNPRGEGEKLRRELLESALELLSDASHPDDVSIRAIARHTGVSPTAAYRHFVDRDDLVYCAIGLAFEHFSNTLIDSVKGSATPFDAMAAAGVAYGEYAEDHPGRYRFLFSNPMGCPTTTTATEEEVAAGDTAFSVLVGLIQDCLDAGAPAAERGVDATYLALQVWTWMHGRVDLGITHPDTEWPDHAEMCADALTLLGLTPPDTATERGTDG